MFLSHSPKDKAVVRYVAERLRKDGVKVWFDAWVLKPSSQRGFGAPENVWGSVGSGSSDWPKRRSN